MMGLVVAGPICSSTHCSAQQALYCKPQGRGCVCVLGGGPLSVPEPCPVSDSLCKQQQSAGERWVTMETSPPGMVRELRCEVQVLQSLPDGRKVWAPTLPTHHLIP